MLSVGQSPPMLHVCDCKCLTGVCAHSLVSLEPQTRHDFPFRRIPPAGPRGPLWPGSGAAGVSAGVCEGSRTQGAVHHELCGERHQGDAQVGKRHGIKHKRGIPHSHMTLCSWSFVSEKTKSMNCPPQVLHLSGRYEIVSLVGTLNPDAHLHVCLADAEGGTVGGHVLGGLEVFTTAEVVIGEATQLQFERELDEQTGFPELVVQRR
uniref:Bifunctional protein GlmU-like n=1 Tax=Labrus bergylta TaxID=56723 RepID=A0A3Q3NFH1_9LABR